MQKVFVTTPKVGTNEHFPVEGTGSPAMTVGGRSIPARPCQYIWFRKGTFVADSTVRYKLYDDIDGELVIDQVAYMDAHPNNVANGGRAFQQHRKWMDKVDAARLLQSNASRMSDAAFLKALHKIEAMPEGETAPVAAKVQVHVGVRDAGASGRTLAEVEPNYGDTEAINAGFTQADPGVADVLKEAMKASDG